MDDDGCIARSAYHAVGPTTNSGGNSLRHGRVALAGSRAFSCPRAQPFAFTEFRSAGAVLRLSPRGDRMHPILLLSLHAGTLRSRMPLPPDSRSIRSAPRPRSRPHRAQFETGFLPFRAAARHPVGHGRRAWSGSRARDGSTRTAAPRAGTLDGLLGLNGDCVAVQHVPIRRVRSTQNWGS